MSREEKIEFIKTLNKEQPEDYKKTVMNLTKQLAKEDYEDRIFGMETEFSKTEQIGRPARPVRIKPQ